MDEYDAVLVISTYRRNELLRTTLRQLRDEDTRYRVQLIVINDGNPLHTMKPIMRENPDVLFLHNRLNHGKHRYWKTVTKLLRAASQFRYQFLIQMDDDFMPVNNFFDTIVAHLYRMPPRTILKYVTNENGPEWGYEHWVDGGAAYPRAFLDQISHKIDRVPLRRWIKQRWLSSGVWRQVTEKLNALDYKVEFLQNSMADHLGYRDSVMHPELRRTHQLKTASFSNEWQGLTLG